MACSRTTEGGNGSKATEKYALGMEGPGGRCLRRSDASRNLPQNGFGASFLTIAPESANTSGVILHHARGPFALEIAAYVFGH
jgi:hypothetical protein